MRLSEEIKQRAFKSAHEEALLNIHFTSHWLYRMLDGQLSGSGISPEQYNILRILRGNRDGCYSLGEVRDRMLNRTANTTRLVEKLRQRGLVSRRTNRADRRRVDIRITEAGLALLDAVDRPLGELDRRLRAALSGEEAEQLSRLLERLRERLDLEGLAHGNGS